MAKKQQSLKQIFQNYLKKGIKLERYQKIGIALLVVVIAGFTGWLVYTIGDGTRYWNYADGVWAIGSINGFVCLMSVAVFGLGSLLLVYLVLPVCIYLSQKMSRRAFLAVAISLFAIVMLDEVTNLTLKNLNLPTAMDFYQSLGLEYK